MKAEAKLMAEGLHPRDVEWLEAEVARLAAKGVQLRRVCASWGGEARKHGRAADDAEAVIIHCAELAQRWRDDLMRPCNFEGSSCADELRAVLTERKSE